MGDAPTVVRKPGGFNDPPCTSFGFRASFARVAFAPPYFREGVAGGDIQNWIGHMDTHYRTQNLLMTYYTQAFDWSECKERPLGKVASLPDPPHKFMEGKAKLQ